MPKHNFNVIVTFASDDMEQFFMDLSLNDIPNEEGFVERIMSELAVHELENLVKLSVCHMLGKDEAPCEWLMARQGKFFFNVDVNSDPDTAKWNDVRNAKLELIK